ncbi:probable protein phosphatase 2C 65 isoform X1 [Salvia miltiorrhiza]|uniref:probable protein phosphatase 2C 65 isoform X1 n=2 Tax=Salvia miltiorrhiza TaxID=226208 RepID=UPI0025ABC232|nr:probable protein phosphatase 2C 65 isoform X1 [Salvia miltiorrhiza]
MGACCSCHRGAPIRRYDVEEYEERRRHDDGGVVLRGDGGARVRLQGSSKYVSMYSQQGRKGVNQDAMTVWERFSGDRDMLFCGVFDGHGPSGHKVSQYVRDFLPTKISQLYRQPSIDGRCVVMDIADDETDSRNPLFLSWKARLTQCFHDMDDQLEKDTSIETYCSGTTSVSVLKKGEHLIISNLGDSRAVLCKRDDSNQLLAEQLTVDLKPNVPSETKRIIDRQGRVQAMEEEPNVYRIWMPHEDCPGLAMARAFGDFCLKDYGLISTPVVSYRKLTDRDEFVVLATDGVWDALSNDEVVKIVASARDRSTAAQSLVENAVRAWRDKYPRSKIDDCAVVCLFFKRPAPTEVVQYKSNYPELDSQSCTGSVDALDTVLNIKLDEGEKGEDETVRRPRKRRLGKKLESVTD